MKFRYDEFVIKSLIEKTSLKDPFKLDLRVNIEGLSKTIRIANFGVFTRCIVNCIIVLG